MVPMDNNSNHYDCDCDDHVFNCDLNHLNDHMLLSNYLIQYIIISNWVVNSCFPFILDIFDFKLILFQQVI